MTTHFLSLIAAALLLTSLPAAHAQTPPPAPAEFTGAVADIATYKVVYQIDSSDPKLIGMTLRNMENALADPRLKGKLTVELVAFSGGTTVFLKDQPYHDSLLKLQQQGVLMAQCLNSMHGLHLTKEQLWPFVSYVPSGNGELIIRQAQGWAIIHP